MPESKEMYFSTLHLGSTPGAQLGMFLISIESFLLVNPASSFHLVMLHATGDTPPAPEMVPKLQEKYASRFSSSSLAVPPDIMGSKVRLYAHRFSSEVSEQVGPPGKRVYLDLDLYHSKGISDDLGIWVDWSKLNACLDMCGYDRDQRILRRHNASHRPYINSGVVAWDSSHQDSTNLLGYVIGRCAEVASWPREALERDYVCYDQDVLNDVLCERDPSILHILPSMINCPLRAFGEVGGLVSSAAESVKAYARVLHVFSYHEHRIEFFYRMAKKDGWYRESICSALSGRESGVHVVIISHNQEKSVVPMKQFLNQNFQGCPAIMVLDRCTDRSKEVAEACGMPYIENTEGSGFLAGRMRDFGLQFSGMHDTVFLDGDRIPGEEFDLEASQVALSSYDITLLPVAEGEYRKWFQHNDMVENPSHGTWDNDVFTCGMVVRASALKSITESQNGLLFVKDFDGRYGEEDRYLGDIAYHLGLTCGGFPQRMALSGGFRPRTDVLEPWVNVKTRETLRSSLRCKKAKPIVNDRRTIRERLRTSTQKIQH